MSIGEQEKLLLALIIQQGERLFYGENETEIQGFQNLIMTFSEAQPKRQKHEKILGYIDLTSRYLEDDFKSHFRMGRPSMEALICVVASNFCKESLGRPQENTALQCLVTVWVLANQESYRSIADRFNISKSTVFHCMRRVCEILNKEAGNFIKWPDTTTATGIIQGFKKVKSFPGVIGAIDGCHIDILPMKENGAAYINRKGRTSMVLQGVCDHNCKFTDCLVGFPGSVHDARVFQRSAIGERCKNAQFFPHDSHILGDSAYPIGTHILVPFRDTGHLNRNQKIYNVAHAATRAMIERSFGI